MWRYLNSRVSMEMLWSMLHQTWGAHSPTSILFAIVCRNNKTNHPMSDRQRWCSRSALGLRSKRTGFDSRSCRYFFEIGYLLLPSRDMAEISLKRRKSSKTTNKPMSNNIITIIFSKIVLAMDLEYGVICVYFFDVLSGGLLGIRMPK